MDTTLTEKTYRRVKIGGYLYISRELPLDDEAFVKLIQEQLIYDARKKCNELYPGKAILKADLDRFEEGHWIDDVLGGRSVTAYDVDMYGNPARRAIIHQVSVYVEE